MVRASEGTRDLVMSLTVLAAAFLFAGCAGRVTGPASPTAETTGTVPGSGVVAGPATTTVGPPNKPCWQGLSGDAPIAGARIAATPNGLSNVLARVSHTASFVYGDLAYEGNNADVRGPTNDDGMYALSGADVAARWRDIADQVDRLFVLRDSLWSQQDHPYRHGEPCALMLPPNWITAAVALDSPLPVTAPPVDDDAAWASLAGEQTDVFGTFPPSEALHEVATRTPTTDAERRATANARVTLQLMSSLADQLLDERRDNGPDAALRVGAELIARGDIVYFGAELRRSTIVPILVPNVAPKEIEEGKGFAVPNTVISDETIRTIEHVVFERRLLDGDIALERYDLTNQVDQRLAIAMLERLIPEGGPEGATVWLWINGRLDPDRKLRGEDPTAYVADFRQKLDDARINLDRLDFVSKPVVEVDSLDELRAAAERYDALGLPLSVTLTPAGIAGLE